jgi:hypothetical protein
MPEGAGKVLVMLTARQEDVDVMLHELVAVTHIFPLPLPEVTTMLVLPWPEVMVHPVGTVQA